MHEPIISLDTAMIAKIWDFNWPCRAYYKMYYNSESGHREINDHSVTYEVLPDNHIVTCYLLPTQSLLQKWLREIKDIYVNVSFDGHMFDVNILNMKTGDHKELFSTLSNSFGYCFTEYEEALEEGLQGALKMITHETEKLPGLPDC